MSERMPSPEKPSSENPDTPLGWREKLRELLKEGSSVDVMEPKPEEKDPKEAA